MVKLEYSTLSVNGKAVCSVQSMPLGCCGAVGLHSLSDNASRAVIEEALHFLGVYGTFKGQRAIVIIPISQDKERTNRDYYDDDDDPEDSYGQMFVDEWMPALEASGWTRAGTVWNNPNSGRDLSIFIKDL